jgi:hypothetical protein
VVVEERPPSYRDGFSRCGLKFNIAGANHQPEVTENYLRCIRTRCGAPNSIIMF